MIVSGSPGCGAWLASGIGCTFGRRMANAAKSQSRSIRNRYGARAEAVGKVDDDRSGGVAHHVPVGQHQAGGFVDGHQRAGAVGDAVAFGRRPRAPRPDAARRTTTPG